MLFFKILASTYLSTTLIKNQTREKSDQGLTLVELLISGVIVGILSILATPAYIATIGEVPHLTPLKVGLPTLKN